MLVGITGAIIIIALVAKKLGLLDEPGSAPQDGPLPYEKRGSALTKNEADFYLALREACKDLPIVVFAQLPIDSLVYVSRGTPSRQSWVNRINRKSVDFVLCDEKTSEWVLAIELDDASHSKTARAERDRFVNKVFETIGAPLLRLRAQPNYSAQELRGHITRALT